MLGTLHGLAFKLVKAGIRGGEQHCSLHGMCNAGCCFCRVFFLVFVLACGERRDGTSIPALLPRGWEGPWGRDDLDVGVRHVVGRCVVCRCS